jgi:multimeric flavodoxin WrbA
MKLLIIQTSLNKNSKTNITSREAFNIWIKKWLDIEFLDLRDYNLEMCNWEKIEMYNNDMNTIKDKVQAADAYILAYPVYNYSLSWVCKNFIDIFSYYMNSKKCWIIHNSYSERSFSDGMGELFKILWLHDNVDIVLPVVHSCNNDFDGNNLTCTKVIEKINKLIKQF